MFFYSWEQNLYICTKLCSLLFFKYIYYIFRLDQPHCTVSTRNILIDEVNNLLYCSIPKVASTSLKLALVKTLIKNIRLNPKAKLHNDSHFLHSYLNSSSNSMHLNNFPVHVPKALNEVGLITLSQFFKKHGRSNGQCILKRLKKFIVVRHPLKRLLSAYLDKFLNVKDRHKYKYIYLLKYILKNKSDNKTLKMIPNFGNFVDFITDHKVPCSNRINSHWAPYWKICRAFQINYNYIIKFENLDIRIKTLWKMLFKENILEKNLFPHKHRGKFNTETVFKNFLSFLNKTQIQNLLNFYKIDFMLFNYSKI